MVCRSTSMLWLLPNPLRENGHTAPSFRLKYTSDGEEYGTGPGAQVLSLWDLPKAVPNIGLSLQLWVFIIACHRKVVVSERLRLITPRPIMPICTLHLLHWGVLNS
jgi:hypothetical protein